MTDKAVTDGSHVNVDKESLWARIADWHTRVKGHPVAGLGRETGEPIFFVADEVLIDGDDQALADELRARYGAEIVPEPLLPPLPSELQKERSIEMEALPRALRLRFSTPPAIDDASQLLERALAETSAGEGEIVATSEMGAAVAAVTAYHALEGHTIGLNLFGETLAMPLSIAQEGPVPGVGSNPLNWQAFSGSSRIADAWQMVDSIRQIRGGRFTTIAILDNGFWLDGNGMPVVAAGQIASDFGGAFFQFNLQNESQPAGGMGSGNWHGNAVASAAAATVNDRAGAAGSGGTVAVPLFFQTDISLDQILRCVRICAAWGIDVLNMSIGTWGQTELWFPTSLWNRVFQFAFDNGVVMIAAAGNDTLNLPDERNIRPATRTPGVLTIGALDAAGNAWSVPGVPAGSRNSGSNFGSSVWLWAPGTSIPVAPDPNNPAGQQRTGTSFAAPLVAGVAAMMRFANESLSAQEIQRILVETGWVGAGRVTRGLDAFAALFEAIRHTLPDLEEPNNTAASARDLIPTGVGNSLAPSFTGFTARSSTNDPDFWKFRVKKFSNVSVTVDWYERLSSLYVSLEAEDPTVRGPEEMTRVGSAQSGRIVLTGLLPRGTYRLTVGGTGVTAYRLLVTPQPAPLPIDMFEHNDSFAQAARLLFEASRFAPFGLKIWGPGSYDATLHQTHLPILTGGIGRTVINDDYFRLMVPANGVFRHATVSVYDADELVDVVLYDEAGNPLQTWTGIKKMVAYPPENTTCYLRVSGHTPTRYRISTQMKTNRGVIPPPYQEELEILPKWWGDPAPMRLKEIVTHYAVEVNENRGDGEALAFEHPAEPVQLELLDFSGQVIGDAQPDDGHLVIDTRGIEPGSYLLRATRSADASQPTVQLCTTPPALSLFRRTPKEMNEDWQSNSTLSRSRPVATGEDLLGEPHSLGISTITYKVVPRKENGVLILENSFHEKGGPARHLHHEQDEWFYVLAGEFIFEIGGEKFTVGPGGSLFAPQGIPHVWAYVGDRAGDAGGRILIAFLPAGRMQAFFREVSNANAMPRQDPELWRAYGMELLGPPLLVE